MGHYRPDHSKSENSHRQTANIHSGNVTQVTEGYTQTTNTRISLWVSIVFVFIFSVGAAVFFRMWGEHLPHIEIQTESPVLFKSPTP